MTSATEKVLADALALPADEREALVEALSSSLEPIDLRPEWQTEIARRVEAIADGDAVLHDAEEHLRALRAKYGG